MKILFKTDKGYEPQDMAPTELVDWFREHTEKDGTVTEEVMLFGDAEVKMVEERVRFIFSDGTLDSDLERIDPSGWKLQGYRKNPVVLWGHEWWRPAIGKASGMKTSTENLSGSVTFDESGTDPFAAMIANKVRGGFITKGSVGFQPLKIEIVEDQKDPTKIIHREQNLLEFSIVNIPSNINAGVQDSRGDEDVVARQVETPVVERPAHYIDLLFSKEFTDETSPWAGSETSSPVSVSETSSLDALLKRPQNITLQEVFNGSTRIEER
jgi:HK97 family phage prohead protease